MTVSHDEEKIMFVRNWMSSPPVTIEPGASVEVARALMEKKRVRRLPVTNRGRLVGILTRSDVEATLGRATGLTIREMYRALDTRVEEVMTACPLTVGPDDAFEHAASLMYEKRVSGLPVVEGTHLVGMITESDIFRAVLEMLGVNEEGTRVVVPMTSPESLVEAFSRFSKGLGVRALVTYHDPATRQWMAVLRVFGRKPRPERARKALASSRR